MLLVGSVLPAGAEPLRRDGKRDEAFVSPIPTEIDWDRVGRTGEARPLPTGLEGGVPYKRQPITVNDSATPDQIKEVIEDPYSRPWSPYRVDNRIIESRTEKGVLENASNSFLVQFREMTRGGVSVRLMSGDVFSFDAVGGQHAVPQIDDGGTSVTYRDVWPDVDVQYVVSDRKVEEFIVLKRKTERSEFAFRTGGGRLEPRESGGFDLLAADAAAGLRVPLPISIQPVIALDSDGVVVANELSGARAEVGAVDASALAEGRVEQVLTVGIDDAYVASLDSADFPIRIDPTMTFPEAFSQQQSGEAIGSGVVSGVNLGTGVYSAEVTDLVVKTASSLPFSVERQYSSGAVEDYWSTGAGGGTGTHTGSFGVGWTSSATRLYSGAEFITGGLIRIWGAEGGWNDYSPLPGGDWESPPGVTDVLTGDLYLGTLELERVDGSMVQFDVDGRRIKEYDSLGRSLSYQYESATPGFGPHYVTKVTDDLSGRAVHYTWISGPAGGNKVISSVKSDPVGPPGQEAPLEWTYRYELRQMRVQDSPVVDIPVDVLTEVYDPNNPYVPGQTTPHVAYTYHPQFVDLDTWTNPEGNIEVEIDYTVTPGFHEIAPGECLGCRRASSVADGEGNTTTMSYVPLSSGPESVVATVTDPRLKQTTWGFDSALRLVRRVNESGKTRSWLYGVNDGLLKEIVFEDHSPSTPAKETFWHDTHRRVVAREDRYGAVGLVEYDTAGRIAALRGPRVADGVTLTPGTSTQPPALSPQDDTYKTSITYATVPGLAIQGLVETTDPAGSRQGAVSTYTNGTEATVPAGGTVPKGLLKKVVTPIGGVSEYFYSAAGDTTRTIDANGLQVDFTYDQLGRELTRTESGVGVDDGGGTGITPPPQTTSTSYDGVSRPTSIVFPEIPAFSGEPATQLKESTAYDNNGNVVLVTTEDDLNAAVPERKTSYEYDDADRQVSEKVWLNGGWLTSTTDYDSNGNVVEVEDALLRRWTASYDDRNNQLSVKLHDIDTLPHDPGGVTDLAVVSREFDDVDRVSAETDAAGRRTEFHSYTYGDTPSITKLMQFEPLPAAVGGPGGSPVDVTTSEKLVHEDGSIWVEFRGDYLELTYREFSPSGEVTREAMVDPATANGPIPVMLRDTLFEYDVDGNLTKLFLDALATSEPDRETRFEYTPGGLQKTQIVENGANDLTTTATFDARGNPRILTDPDLKQSERQYSPQGQLWRDIMPEVQAESPGSAPTATKPTTTTTYNAFGEVSRQVDANGNVTAHDYDELGRETSITHPTYVPPDDSESLVTDMFYGTDGASPDTNRWATSLLGAATAELQDESLRLTTAATGFSMATITATAGNADDTETLLRYRLSDDTTENRLRVEARQQLNGDNYRVQVRGKNNSIYLFKDVNGTATKLDEFNASSATGWQWLRFRVVGDDLKVRQWADGAVEPSTWDIEETDTDIASGASAVRWKRNVSGASSVDIDNLDVKVVGTPAAITPVESFGYDAVGNLTSTTDRRGEVSSFEFDKLNRAIKSTTPSAVSGQNAVALTTYDLVGNVAKVVDPTGAVTSSTYDDLDRLRSVTQEIRAIPGLQSAETNTSWRNYDFLGNVVYERAPDGSYTTSTYNPVSERVSTTAAKSATYTVDRTTTFEYSPFGEELRVVTPEGRCAENAYDQAGRAIAQRNRGTNCLRDAGTSPTWLETTFEYDGRGNRTKVTSPEGRVTTTQYDAAARVESVVNAPGTADASMTSLYYDAVGNNTRIRTGRGNAGTGSAAYDTTISYQSWNLPETRTEPEVYPGQAISDRQWTDIYDASGLSRRATQPEGVRIDRTYTANGLVESELGYGAPLERTIAYDVAARVISAGNARTPSINVTFNDRSQPVSVVNGADTTTYTYNALGRVTQRHDSAGISNFTYKPTGEPDQQTDPLTGGTVAFHQDLDGLPLYEVRYPSGAAVVTPPASPGVPADVYSFDEFGRSTGFISLNTTQYPNTKVALGHTYTLDDDGNRLSTDVFRDSGLAGSIAGEGLHQYTYDNRGQLKTSTSPISGTSSYTYDPDGNRTAAGAVSYTYDAQGRQLTAGTVNNTWSDRGTLELATDPGNPSRTLVHDAEGKQLTSQIGATTTEVVYDALGRIATRDATTFKYSGTAMNPIDDGNWRIVAESSGKPLSLSDGTTARWAITDSHSDLVGLHNTNGTVVDTASFDPWGVTAATTGLGGSLTTGFQSDYTDPASGDVWMGARHYQPGSASFTSRDSYAGDSATPISLNRYTYAHNNPLAKIDPDGHAPVQADFDRYNRIFTNTVGNPANYRNEYDFWNAVVRANDIYKANEFGRLVNAYTLLGALWLAEAHTVSVVNPVIKAGEDWARLLWRSTHPITVPDEKPDPVDDRGTPCSVYRNDYDSVQAMSLDRRARWFYGQLTHAGYNSKVKEWFNNISAVIDIFKNNGIGEPGQWTSYVDTQILVSIAKGAAHQRGCAVTGGRLRAKGVYEWSAFFNKAVVTPDPRRGSQQYLDMRFLWGTAEQKATDFGMVVAHRNGTRSTSQEYNLFIEFGNYYRSVVANPASLRSNWKLDAAIKATCGAAASAWLVVPFFAFIAGVNCYNNAWNLMAAQYDPRETRMLSFVGNTVFKLGPLPIEELLVLFAVP